ncbi:MAG: histidine triad nucleotide-binding protein [Thiobacillus sp.]
MSDCIFCKIVDGQLPSSKVYEDDDVLAFHDIHPFARVHFLIIPKMHIATLADCAPADEGLLGKMLLLAPQLAKAQGLDAGFKTLINTGRAGGQEVFHLHVHVFGGGDPVKRT